MKTLIVLAIGTVLGYHIGSQGIDSVSDITIVIESFLQTMADKLGEYNG